MSFSRVLGGTVLMMSIGLAASCASPPKPESAAPGATVPSTPSPTSLDQGEPEPQTLAEAEASLERAKADLERLALKESVVADADAPATAPAPAAPTRSERAEKAEEAPSPTAKHPDACDTACRAFASLTRASEAVCRLDTEGGKRCERARQIRVSAAQRVASCGCAG